MAAPAARPSVVRRPSDRRAQGRRPADWRPTAAHARAVLVGAIGLVVAVLARRPDLVVIVAPVAVVAAWSASARPTRPMIVDQRLGHAVVHEGQVTTWHVDVVDEDGAVDDVAVVIAPPERIETDPPAGERAISLRDDPTSELSIALRPNRWGRYAILPATVVGSSAWGAFRASAPGGPSRSLLVLPRASGFDASAPPVQSPGLVGLNRSPRQGTGTEFATVRPFQPGDRLRRIHWPHTLRTGVTHVRSTWADHDRHVELLVDAASDVGDSDGIDGAESSLDVAVRACAAVAQHHVAAGDRVSLVVIDGRGPKRVPAGSGHRHLRRILETLAAVTPTGRATDTGAVPRRSGQGELVVLFSPLVTIASMTRAITLADRAAHLVAVDCLPQRVAAQRRTDEFADLAWRIEMLERRRRIRRAGEAGLAVVPWAGPGSLDLVLRELARHGAVRKVGRR